MITRRSDDGVSRMSLLFTSVGVLIVASVVSLVLVSTENDSSGPGNAAAAPPASSASSAPMTVVPTSEAPVSTPAPSASTSPVARTTTMPTRSTKSTASETPAARKPITYTVQKGDNLTVIAAWFKLHGYGDLYARNRKVIGSDPDLIRPGQRITVSSDGMTISK